MTRINATFVPAPARFGSQGPRPGGWEGRLFTRQDEKHITLADPKHRLAGTTLAERAEEASRILRLWGVDPNGKAVASVAAVMSPLRQRPVSELTGEQVTFLQQGISNVLNDNTRSEGFSAYSFFYDNPAFLAQQAAPAQAKPAVTPRPPRLEDVKVPADIADIVRSPDVWDKLRELRRDGKI